MATEEYIPLTPAQAEKRIRDCSRRLLAAIDEHGKAAEAEAEALATYNATYLSAHLISLDENPQRKVGHHETVAQHAAMDAKRALVFATAARRALSEEMHSLRQVLSSLQTNARVMGHMTGDAR